MRWIIAIFIMLPHITFGNVIITEVMCNPVSELDEWVKIINTGEGPVDVKDVKFFDNSFKELSIASGDFSLDKDETAFIIAHKATSTIADLRGNIYTVSSTGLNNAGERIGFGTEFVTYSKQTNKGVLCSIKNRDSVDGGTDTPEPTDIREVNKVITTYKEVTRWETVEIQPPQDIFIRDIRNKTVLLGSELYIRPEVFDATGKSVEAKCHITFGDGAESITCNTEHLYQFVGKYILNINASKNSMQASTRVSIDVIKPNINISTSESGEYVELINDLDSNIELSGWKIKVGHKRFNIPNGTIISANGSIKISAITMDIDINRRGGGVVALVDAFNKIVTDSTTQAVIADEVPQIEYVIEQVEESSEEINIKEVEVEEVINIINTTPVEHKDVLNNSVIGMQVSINEVIAEEEEEKEKKSNNDLNQVIESQVAAAVSTPTNSILPTDIAKWSVALLAIIGIAIIPVIFRRKEDDTDT